MYPEDNFIQLSSLQHYQYCPRQCALIHLDQQWSENKFTAEGQVQHERVDKVDRETRRNLVVEYALIICSHSLRLSGKADVVEFHNGIAYPVEHKRGKPKLDTCDMVQVCAQALCLEEMLNQKIPEGAIFYGKPRRRQIIKFTKALRIETIEISKKVHELIRSQKIPSAEYNSKKCSACSLIDICLPKLKRSVNTYIENNLL